MPKSAKSFRQNLRKSGVFFTPKKLANDIFRGMLRHSGISRFRAGVDDKCVEWFADGGKHCGNDEYGNADSVEVSVAI